MADVFSHSRQETEFVPTLTESLTERGKEVSLCAPVAGYMVRVFDSCPAWRDPGALLKLAAPDTTNQLPAPESTGVKGS